jgi:hypothetical protein
LEKLDYFSVTDLNVYDQDVVKRIAKSVKCFMITTCEEETVDGIQATLASMADVTGRVKKSYFDRAPTSMASFPPKLNLVNTKRTRTDGLDLHRKGEIRHTPVAHPCPA